MFQYTTWGRKIFFNFQILFLTPFCNQKRYFCVFWPFYTQILTKKPKITKITNTMSLLTKLQNYNNQPKIDKISTNLLCFRVFWPFSHLLIKWLAMTFKSAKVLPQHLISPKTQKYRFRLQKEVKIKIWRWKNIFWPKVVYWIIL